MELLLIRHGQPSWVSGDGRGVNDPGLTDLGKQQAQLVAERLGGLTYDGPTHLLVSDARRAMETAEPIATAMGIDAAVRPWLHELRLPDAWEGIPAEEISRRMHATRNQPRHDWWSGIEGSSESVHEFHDRVTTGFEGLLADHGIGRHLEDPEHLWSVPDEPLRLVIVGHAGTNSVIVSHALGVEPQPWNWERFASNHASLTILDTTRIAGGSIWSLQLFSGVAHLATGGAVTK